MIRRAIRMLSVGASAVLIGMVRAYQAALSPVIGRQCRFQPTCSQYFIEAVRLRGPLIGAALGLWRILRCHPFSHGGYDPVSKPPQRGIGGDSKDV